MLKFFSLGFLAGCIAGACTVGLISHLLDNYGAYQDFLGNLNTRLGERILLTSLAPNKQARVIILDSGSLGRNFKVVLQDGRHQNQILFLSPDESYIAGSQRVMWSANSQEFSLVFNSSEMHGLRLNPDEIIYLRYNLVSSTLYCPKSLAGISELKCQPIEQNREK